MTTAPRTIPQTADELAETIQTLRDFFPDGSDVTTVHIASNHRGDSHRFKVLGIRPAVGQYATAAYDLHNATHLLVKAGLGKLDNDLNIVVGGGNMDMAADLTMRLSDLLYGNAYRLTNHAL